MRFVVKDYREIVHDLVLICGKASCYKVFVPSVYCVLNKSRLLIYFLIAVWRRKSGKYAMKFSASL